MRVLHVIPSLDPVTGGPPLMVSRLAVAQAALGHQVETLSYGRPPYQARIDEFLRSMPGHERVKHHYLPPITRFEHLFARAAIRQSDPYVIASDIVHLHGIWDPVIRAVAAVAARHHVPYTITPHGMLNPWTLTQSSWKKKAALLLGYRNMIDRAAFMHVLNTDEQRLIGPMVPKDRTVIIPNGIALDELEPLPASGTFRAKYPKLQEKPYVLFLGRLHHKKGLDYLADIFAKVAAQLAEIQLVVAGPDAGAGKSFMKQIATHQLTDRTHLVGPLYDRDKYAAFIDAACFCLPSREEGFSIAILESMACSTPVIISDACHFPEVAENNAGFVAPLDVNQLGDAVIRVLSDTTLRAKMAAAGQRLVQKAYTWPKIAEQMIVSYKRVLEIQPTSIN